jgi:hypothetical protein
VRYGEDDCACGGDADYPAGEGGALSGWVEEGVG